MSGKFYENYNQLKVLCQRLINKNFQTDHNTHFKNILPAAGPCTTFGS